MPSAFAVLRLITSSNVVGCSIGISAGCDNPDRIRSQLEGAVIMGLSVAMRGGITFKNGRVEQSNFNQYTVLRMNEAPRDIRVYNVPASYDTPLGGVGEPGLPPIAPALCNAIFAATGKRIRSLPITGDAARSSDS